MASANVYLGCGGGGGGGGGGGVPGRTVGPVMYMTTSAVPGKKKRKNSSAENGETANGIKFETGKVISHMKY